MVQEELSKEDKGRILSCDNYKKTKEIMKAHRQYKDLPLGEVYLIKSLSYDGTYRYENRGYATKPSKFMIFHKDEDGFVFMKRINADGKLGIEVVCLTTQYSSPNFIIEPDPEYVEAIIFENTKTYDPLKVEKEYSKKKSKASRKNKKLEIKFESAQDAFDYIKTFSVGDKLWEARTTFGSKISEFTISNIKITPTLKKGDKAYNLYDRENSLHERENFTEKIILSMNTSEGRAAGYRDIKVTFYDFLLLRSTKTYYKSEPYTPENF